MWIKTDKGQRLFIIPDKIADFRATSGGSTIITMVTGHSYRVGFPLTQVVTGFGFSGPELN